MNSKPAAQPAGFSRRSLLFFILLAPAGILFVAAIIMVTQYKQFKSVVSPTPTVSAFTWDSTSHARLDSVFMDLHDFVTGKAEHDSLWLDAQDLKVLLASSPTAAKQDMRFDVSDQDSLLIVRSTQPVQAMQGNLAWMFKKMARTGYLNAQLEGTPELKEGKLFFSPKNGYLNGQRVPSVALQKRGGMSPVDFVEHPEAYNEFLSHVKSVALIHGRVLFLRNP